MILVHLFGAGVIGPRPKSIKQAHDQQEFEFTTLTQEGSFIPLLIGRRRIGHFVGWAGDRKSIPVTTRVSTKGRKKKKVQGTPVWTEAAWHLLCVGPAFRLHKVYQDGKIIWDGPVDSDTTPSGTALQTIAGEEFTIYWGEEEQPVNAFLGDADRVGITSRWPFHCYVVWTAKQLGNAPRWPLIEYDIEVLPTLGGLDHCAFDNAIECVSGPDAADAPVDTGEARITNNATTGVQTSFDESAFNIPTTGYYRVHQDPAAGQDLAVSLNHVPGTKSATATWGSFELSLDGVTMREFTNGGVIDATTPDDECWDYSPGSGATPRTWSLDEAHLPGQVVHLASGAHVLRVDSTVTEDGSGADNNHVVIGRLWFQRLESVALPTALTQLLFAPWPHGLGLDPDAFDLASFTTLDTLLTAEGLTDLSVYAPGGMEALTAVAGLLQDLGVLLSLDVTAGGKFAVKALRQADATLSVPASMIANTPREMENVHGDRPATRLIYTFVDVAREHRESTVTIDHDGAADNLALHRARKISILSVTDLASASIVAERRSQEEIAGEARFRFTMNRGARLLVPGQRIAVPGVNDVLRVVEVAPETAHGECQITAVPDFYGAQAATYEASEGGDGSSSGVDPEEDLASSIVEVPAVFAGGTPSIIVPRIRANDQVIFADMHLSGDDTTYHLVDREGAQQTGGELLDAIAADDPWEIAQGPTLTALGPDIDLAEDYSTDEEAWRSGRQIAVIGDEWFFLQKITAMGGAVYRLDGLIRARFDSVRAAHSVGAKVFIFSFDEILDMSDPLVAPDELLYVKPQPWTSSPLSLASVTALSKTLYGKGLKPGPVSALRVTLPRNGVPAYYTGEDVRFSWGYRSAEVGVGAGMQPAGSITGDADIDGEFEVKVYDAGAVLVRTEVVSTPVYLYSNATLQADLGGETNFTIEVRHTKNGYRSSAVSLAITKL